MEDSTVIKERILLVHNFYQIGGGEHTVYENERRLLIEHGHHLITYTRDNSELNHSIVKKILLPITVVFSIKTYNEVKKIIKKEHIDIVHCHNTFPLISPAVYYAAWKCKVPVIQTVHNFRFICPNGVFFRDNHTCEDCLIHGLGQSIKNSCYRNSKLQTIVLVNMLKIHRWLGTYKRLNYIFLTDFNRSKFTNLLGDHLRDQFTKPNFEFIDLPEADEERDGSFVYIGRLDKNKGIDFLVDNWTIDRELYVFGNGALEDYVTDKCKENKHIHLMGFRPQTEVWRYLKRATALIFSTDLYEGFPMSLIESFALGTPVLCTDIGNGADIVKKESAGTVYIRRNKESFFEALGRIENNFQEYSINAKNAYYNHYIPEVNYKQLMSIYGAIKSEG